MFDSAFSHFLSYGATDQKTARDLTEAYTGLLVPGTVASFQRDGTGGFVLTLSATREPPIYIIDPRFPLFQQALPFAKKSHQALADILGAPELVRDVDPRPSDFTPELIRTVAANWTAFNSGYQTIAGSKFDKYAKRLGETVAPRNAQQPYATLPPYFIASGLDDPWWEKSQALFDATAEAHADPDRCVRVIAAASVSALTSLLRDVRDERVAIWVSRLDELTAGSGDLVEYAQGIAEWSSASNRAFALYGGFFSVLMGNVGLSGSSHGIGYGEYRDWVELPESGPPPARYYLPQLHRYVQPDEATRLYFADARLASCDCAECEGAPPLTLDYHQLMKHSVRCRAREISEWSGLSVNEVAERLAEEVDTYARVLRSASLPEVAMGSAFRRLNPLRDWADAFRKLASG